MVDGKNVKLQLWSVSIIPRHTLLHLSVVRQLVHTYRFMFVLPLAELIGYIAPIWGMSQQEATRLAILLAVGTLALSLRLHGPIGLVMGLTVSRSMGLQGATHAHTHTHTHTHIYTHTHTYTHSRNLHGFSSAVQTLAACHNLVSEEELEK